MTRKEILSHTFHLNVFFFFAAAAVISDAGPFPSMWWTAKRPAAGRWISMEKEKSGPLRRAAPYAYAFAI